eukprot:GHRQ01006560.1.p1 GENE.GHRQ01006560.1~~GHRQ01006560.1.p1  ORF type:complete len:203 (-),score=31.47 GHRQ01006560.1:113-721(-)
MINTSPLNSCPAPPYPAARTQPAITCSKRGRPASSCIAACLCRSEQPATCQHAVTQPCHPYQALRQPCQQLCPCLARYQRQRLSRPEASRQVQPPAQLHAEAQQAVTVQRLVSQQQPPVLDEHCCRQVQVQVGGQGAGPAALPQAQHLVERKLPLEVDEQPPEREEVVQAPARLKNSVQRRVQHLQALSDTSALTSASAELR